MTLDIITHLPRSVFSDTQLELLLWLLQVNGIDNTPSVKVMKEEQKHLQELAGIDTRKYKGALGHVYHVNDIGQIIAQVSVYCFLATSLTDQRPYLGNGQPSRPPVSQLLSRRLWEASEPGMARQPVAPQDGPVAFNSHDPHRKSA